MPIRRQPARPRRGAALVLVVLAIAFISVVAVSLLDEATLDMAIQQNHVRGLEATFAAHAGVEETLARLRNDPDLTGTVTHTPAPGSRSFSFVAEITNNRPRVTVVSTGTSGDYTRKVEARVLVAGPGAVSPYPVRLVAWKDVAGL